MVKQPLHSVFLGTSFLIFGLGVSCGTGESSTTGQTAPPPTGVGGAGGQTLAAGGQSVGAQAGANPTLGGLGGLMAGGGSSGANPTAGNSVAGATSGVTGGFGGAANQGGFAGMTLAEAGSINGSNCLSTTQDVDSCSLCVGVSCLPTDRCFHVDVSGGDPANPVLNYCLCDYSEQMSCQSCGMDCQTITGASSAPCPSGVSTICGKNNYLLICFGNQDAGPQGQGTAPLGICNSCQEGTSGGNCVGEAYRNCGDEGNKRCSDDGSLILNCVNGVEVIAEMCPTGTPCDTLVYPPQCGQAGMGGTGGIGGASGGAGSG